MSAVKGRFAPTPSGNMHLGNALCYLLAWLSARSQGGSVVLRFEDTDLLRFGGGGFRGGGGSGGGGGAGRGF